MKAISVSPVFHVSDLERSIRFYKETLGFTESFRFGSYLGLKLGEVALHLTVGGGGDYRRPIGGGTVYIFCDSVDSFYESITAVARRPAPPLQIRPTGCATLWSMIPTEISCRLAPRSRSSAGGLSCAA